LENAAMALTAGEIATESSVDSTLRFVVGRRNCGSQPRQRNEKLFDAALTRPADSATPFDDFDIGDDPIIEGE
jgi:hypothetical protein